MMDSQRRPLSDDQEMAFENWFYGDPKVDAWRQAFEKRFGEMPNMDDPQYDYRTAWRYGVAPEPYAPDGGFPHWGSEVDAPPFAQPLMLKQEGHPTLWMQKFMDAYGVDPNLASPEMLGDAMRRGIVPPPPLFPARQQDVDPLTKILLGLP